MNFKLFNLCLISFLSVITTNLNAANHTVSLGYAKSQVEDIDLKGFNISYRQQLNEPLSIFASASYQSADENWADESEFGKFNIKYLSVLVGPAYRFNEYLSVYGVAGLAHTKIEDRNMTPGYVDSFKLTETNFAYGAGVIANPTPSISVNVGFEGTTIASSRFKGFNVGVGYSF